MKKKYKTEKKKSRQDESVLRVFALFAPTKIGIQTKKFELRTYIRPTHMEYEIWQHRYVRSMYGYSVMNAIHVIFHASLAALFFTIFILVQYFTWLNII